jgi:hypothetical protein
MASDDRYLEFLRSVPPFSTLGRSPLHELARLIDDVRIPARATVRPARRELVILADGRMAGPAGAMTVGDVLSPCTATATTDVRLVVIGGRQLPGVLALPGVDRALFDATAAPPSGPRRADAGRTDAGTLLR